MLERHAESRGSAVRRIEARVRRRSDAIEVSYLIEGDLERVLVPAPRPARAAERLWEHTCCEMFVARKGASGYQEFNFSPSGEWAGYAFASYRQAAASKFHANAPQVFVHRQGSQLVLEARAPLNMDSAIEAGLSAVIEEQGGVLSYWALRHPPGKPDFHHRDSFAMELDEVRD